jgi:hypothetical protein
MLYRKLTEPQRTKEQADNLRKQIKQDMQSFLKSGKKIYKAYRGESAYPDKALSLQEINRRGKIAKGITA